MILTGGLDLALPVDRDLFLESRVRELIERDGREVDVRLERDAFFFQSRRRHTRLSCDWSSDVCSSDLTCELKSHDKQKTAYRLSCDWSSDVWIVRGACRERGSIRERDTQLKNKVG